MREFCRLSMHAKSSKEAGIWLYSSKLATSKRPWDVHWQAKFSGPDKYDTNTYKRVAAGKHGELTRRRGNSSVMELTGLE